MTPELADDTACSKDFIKRKAVARLSLLCSCSIFCQLLAIYQIYLLLQGSIKVITDSQKECRKCRTIDYLRSATIYMGAAFHDGPQDPGRYLITRSQQAAWRSRFTEKEWVGNLETTIIVLRICLDKLLALASLTGGAAFKITFLLRVSMFGVDLLLRVPDMHPAFKYPAFRFAVNWLLQQNVMQIMIALWDPVSGVQMDRWICCCWWYPDAQHQCYCYMSCRPLCTVMHNCLAGLTLAGWLYVVITSW